MMTSQDPAQAHLPASSPKLQNGTFTVEHPETGRHYTVKLHTVTSEGSKLFGKRIFSLLIGPSNETDFVGVAFWDDEKRTAFVWRKFRSTGTTLRPDGVNWSKHWSKPEKKLGVLIDLALRGEGGFWSGDGYILHTEGRCVRCNRKLTTPESIKTGIGPVCAGRE